MIKYFTIFAHTSATQQLVILKKDQVLCLGSLYTSRISQGRQGEGLKCQLKSLSPKWPGSQANLSFSLIIYSLQNREILESL